MYTHSFNHDIDQYFAKKGVKVVYNTLMADEYLMRSFVKDYQHIVDRMPDKKSRTAKTDIYQTMYPIESRKKLTGFENMRKLDMKKRLQLNNIVPKPNRMLPLFTLGKVQSKQDNHEVKSLKYKEALKNKLRTYENPIIYLSGGADSELVAYALLDSGIKFKVVICQWMLEDGTCANHDDIKYALNFCGNQKIVPIIKKINIVDVWNSKLFDQIAINTYQRSPQMALHAYIIEMMDDELPNHTHLMGGEINFVSDHVYEGDDLERNIIWYDKASFMVPAGQAWGVAQSVIYSPLPSGDYNFSIFQMGSTQIVWSSREFGSNYQTFTWLETPYNSTQWYKRVSNSFNVSSNNPTAIPDWYPGSSSTSYSTGSLSCLVQLRNATASGANGYLERQFSIEVYGDLSPGVIGGGFFVQYVWNNF